MPKIILIQGSLRERSHTAFIIQAAAAHLKRLKISCEIIDLRSTPQPFCDGREMHLYPEPIRALHERLRKAKAFIFGMPVYCQSVSGPLKNFIDIHSRAFDEKLAGIISVAGSEKSYLASSDLQHILSYESSCEVVHPIVFASRTDFMGDHLDSKKPKQKLKEMVEELSKRV
ncbi:NAD(P)H-dependent oxidoreductase [Patescibacteria group bacterium]|nr:NAD(P)H-dependent oxidoreductase [Patescibacteria group bacterium]